MSCPSCGRTLFDLQEVTEQIRTRTGHLPGQLLTLHPVRQQTNIKAATRVTKNLCTRGLGMINLWVFMLGVYACTPCTRQPYRQHAWSESLKAHTVTSIWGSAPMGTLPSCSFLQSLSHGLHTGIACYSHALPSPAFTRHTLCLPLAHTLHPLSASTSIPIYKQGQQVHTAN